MWAQIWIEADMPVSVIQEAAAQCEHLGVLPVAPQGTPIKNADGYYEFRMFDYRMFAMQLLIAKLDQYRLRVVDYKINEGD